MSAPDSMIGLPVLADSVLSNQRFAFDANGMAILIQAGRRRRFGRRAYGRRWWDRGMRAVFIATKPPIGNVRPALLSSPGPARGAK